MPTLSIIIPAKNEEFYLPILLSAIRSQTLQPDEIIVADAGSTDSTRSIAEKFGAKVIQGGLPGPGRNAGAQVATGELLLFLDADVFFPNEKFLENAVKEFEERKLDITTADLFLVEGTTGDKFGHTVYNRYVRIWGKWHPHTPGGCILVRKTTHDKIHGFDPSVVFCEDHDYGTRASRVGKFGFLNTVRIGVVSRRLDKEGRAGLVLKYILAEFHIMFIGPIRHGLFKYEFGYEKEKEKDKS